MCLVEFIFDNYKFLSSGFGVCHLFGLEAEILFFILSVSELILTMFSVLFELSSNVFSLIFLLGAGEAIILIWGFISSSFGRVDWAHLVSSIFSDDSSMAPCWSLLILYLEFLLLSNLFWTLLTLTLSSLLFRFLPGN